MSAYETISIIFSFVTISVLIWTLYWIFRYTKATEIQVNHLIASNEPNVNCYFDFGNNEFTILLIIANEGNQPALNVKLEFNPDFDCGEKVYNEYFKNNVIHKKGISFLAPHKKYAIMAGSTTSASDKFNSGGIPSSYEVTISYENLKGQFYKDVILLSIDQFFNRIVNSEKDEVSKSLIEINNTLKQFDFKIVQYLKNKSQV